jgi:microcystin-dependent protein
LFFVYKKYYIILYNIMSKQEHAKDIRKIFGSVKIYKSAVDDWVTIHSPEIGDIKHSVRSDDHVGWLKCDGRALNRGTYGDLYAVIGTSFGVGDGTATFNLPDAQGRVLGGVGSGAGLTARTTGAKVGAETHTLTSGEMPSHTHTSNAVGTSLGLIKADGASTTGGGVDTAPPGTEPNVYAAPVALEINATGGGLAHNNMQPTLFIGNVFIFGSHQI